MKRKHLFLVSTILLLTIILSACACKHEWKEATCLAPKTCSLCNETEGEFADHAWEANRKVCMVCGLDERPVDEKFMESLAAGLEARWLLTDAKNSTNENPLKTDWENYFRAEYDQIKSYEKESFVDKNLEKWAKKYIDSIGESIEVLAYYGTNQWTQKYSNGVYHDRSIALYNIHDICPVPVSAEKQANLLEILSNGEAISMIWPLLEKVEFKEVEDSYGWKTYQAVVENTTTLTFTYFSFDIDLIDKDGVTITTESAWAENWEPGEKVRFEFSTDETFAEMNVEYARWNY